MVIMVKPVGEGKLVSNRDLVQLVHGTCRGGRKFLETVVRSHFYIAPACEQIAVLAAANKILTTVRARLQGLDCLLDANVWIRRILPQSFQRRLEPPAS